MSKLNVGRLIDEPHYSFADFSKNYSKAKTKPKYTHVNHGPARLYFDLTNVLSGVYNHGMRPQISLVKSKTLLNKQEIFNAIVDNIYMIESTLLFWMAVQFNKERRVLGKVESVESFAHQPLEQQVERTQGRVPLEYLNDRNLEHLLLLYNQVIEVDKIENPGRYGKTRKLKQTP